MASGRPVRRVKEDLMAGNASTRKRQSRGKRLFLRAYNSLDPILRLLLEVNLDLYQQWY